MSLLDEKIFNNFLYSGALISLGNQQWAMAWGKATINPERDAERPESLFSFYLSEFFEEKGAWVSYENGLVINTNEFKLGLEAFERSLGIPKSSISRKWEEPDRQEFSTYFDKFRSDCDLKKVSKVVPVVFEKSSGVISISEKVDSLQALLQVPEGVFAYGYWNEYEGFLGASPEVLLKREGLLLQTMALAGTGKNSDDILSDKKELFEHQCVVDDIEFKLKDLNLTWKPTKEWSVGPLKHLRTFAETKSNKSIGELIQRMHPTAALGGAPGRLSFSYLEKFCDTKKRKYFGAPFGVKFKETELIIVALRNIQWFEGCTYLGSGCGLVAESQPEKEWQELKLKRDFTKKFLGL